MKALIYARCSTTDSKQDITLQTEPLIEFCKRYQWEYVVKVEYASGKDLKKRPVLTDILENDVFRKTADVVIVTKIDRLARSMQDFVNIVMKLDNAGVRFIAVQQGIDTDQRSPSSRLLMNVLAAMAEFERELIRERVKEGLEKAKREGRPIGPPRVTIDVLKAKDLLQKMSYRKAAKAMGVNVMTLQRRIKEYANNQATD